MKKSFMRYGIYGGVVTIALYALNMLIFGGTEANYAIAEVAGYTAIVISLLFVYFGIRYYRDGQNNGVLTFWQGIKTGTLITLIPAVCFGLTDVVYVKVFDPGFYEKYAKIEEAKMRASMPAAEFAAKSVEMHKQMLFFSQPLVDFALMFITVAAVGIIITVISTFILKRPPAKTTVVYAPANTFASTVN